MKGLLMNVIGRIAVFATAAAGLMAAQTALCQQKFPSELVFDKSGAFKFDDLSFQATHYDSSWRYSGQGGHSVQPDAGFPSSKPGLFELQGSFQLTPPLSFKFEEKAMALDANGIQYSFKVKSPGSPVESNELSLSVSLPCASFAGKSVSLDGKSFELPAEFAETKAVIGSSQSCERLEIPCSNGWMTVEGKFKALVQDGRKFKGDSYAIRLGFSPNGGKIDESSISLKISLKPFDARPLDISKQANMGFRDETAGDAKGGWTDQGPENDLRMFKPGRQKLGGLLFDVLDPASNGGKSCIVLGGAERDYLMKSAEIPFDGSAKFIYLLHALAWPAKSGTEIGSISVTRKDGSVKSIPVVCGPEVGNWWEAASRERGHVVWSGENKSSFVGLYLTKYQLDGAPITSVKFESNGKSVWMIAGAVLSNDDVPTPKEEPTYIVEGPNWKAYPYERDVEPGSVMDFSFLLDAPAGKHGFVKLAGDRMEFESQPGKTARFYGANTCFTANFLDKEWAEKLADRIARMGYNSVRFHHFDNGLVLKKDKCTTELDPEQLDKLEYLFSCLKKRGIYITIDLYISRTVAKGELPELPNFQADYSSGYAFKGLVFTLDSAMKNWQTFSKNLLNHVNPYTGLAWKDDPALITISLVNEDTIFHCYSNAVPELKALFRQRFDEWLKEKSISPATPEEKESYLQRFLVDLHNRKYEEMKSFLHGIGVRALLTDQNMQENPVLSFMRDNYDIEDNHFYWDHPHFVAKAWSLPATLSNSSVIKRFAAVPGTHFPARMIDKPMTITEFDFANPDAFGAESGPIVGAYSSLQDWSGLWRFAFAHDDKSLKSDAIQDFFNVTSDPIKGASDRIGTLLFLRGDVKRSETVFPVILTDKFLESPDSPNNYPSSVWKLGLVGRTGTIVASHGPESVKLPAGSAAVIGIEKSSSDPKLGIPFFKATAEGDCMKDMLDAGVLSPSLADLKDGVMRSTTGQLELNQKELTFKAVTDASETFVLPEGKAAEGKVLKVEANDSWAVFFAAAVDGKPLAESGRVLILHLTDSQNSKTKYGNKLMTILESYGTLPYLIRGGTAKLTLKGAFQGHKLYTVGLSGKRLFEVKPERDGSSASFKASVFNEGGSVIAYELVKE